MAKAPAGEILQLALSDLIYLSLVAKQAHWNIHGPQFRSVHLHLDEVVDETRLWSDDVAERMAAMGTSPDGRPAFVGKSTTLKEVETGALGADKVIVLFAELLQAAADEIKRHLGELEDDLLSQDLLIGIATGLEKQAWMFRSAEK